MDALERAKAGVRLNLLKGIVRNICDMITSASFQQVYLQSVNLPETGKWIINLKSGSVKDQKDKVVNAPFARTTIWFTALVGKQKISIDKYFARTLVIWFTTQVEKQKISIDKIDEATVTLDFNLNGRRPVICSCRVKAGGRIYSYECPFGAARVL